MTKKEPIEISIDDFLGTLEILVDESGMSLDLIAYQMSLNSNKSLSGVVAAMKGWTSGKAMPSLTSLTSLAEATGYTLVFMPKDANG